MRGRTNRLAITVLLTLVDVAAGKYYCGVIWQAFSQDIFARAALLGLLCLWIASAAVLWLHVANDLRKTLRERDSRLALTLRRFPPSQRGTPMFESLEDLATRLSAIGYFIDPVMDEGGVSDSQAPETCDSRRTCRFG
jgi:hypothetical protein